MPAEVLFLTRPGCPHSPVMRQRLGAALRGLATSPPYVIVDLSTLAEDDCRRRYPTPTVLVDGRDLFGMPAPVTGAPT